MERADARSDVPVPISGRARGARKAPEEAILRLQRGAGNRALRQLLARAPSPTAYPWVGRIKPWSAALRAGPTGPGQGKANTVADLPRGTEVRVTGKQAGWLSVTARVGGKTLGGYVSHELIEFLRKDVFEGDLGEVRVHVPSAADALVKLKGLEKRQERGGGKLKLDDDEQSDAELAMGVLEQSKKYDVDHRTFAVTFHRSASQKTTVRTIEDFVLFVEEVERAYPRATLAEVASELRQLWFSDSSWDILSAGEGISEGSKLVDIESEGPVAASFDMKQIAPKGGGLQLNTRYGRLDIGHVVAGMDLALNGMPINYPKAYLKKRGIETWMTDTAYDFMKKLSGGHTADFATWSGDVGQAYAEYLLDRYVRGKRGTTLSAEVDQWAPDDQLLGDVHGYYAVAIFNNLPSDASPTGTERRVSNILRDIYLTPHGAVSYRTGKSGAELEQDVTERSLAFGSMWYAKQAWSASGGLSGQLETDVQSLKGFALRPTTMVQNHIDEFYEHHAENEAHAAAADKLQVIVKKVAAMLSGTLR
jgi:hypothetical protein